MYRLLVADDEQIVLDSIKFIVEKNFNGVVTVETARSGREAVEKAESLKPDFVFMDIKMPGINGIDAIREIKSRYNHALFVIITAYEQFDFAKEAVKLGVMEYLLKPVNREKVVETIRKVIGILEAEREKGKKQLELMEKFENVMPVLEHGMIYSIVIFDDNKKELENYMHIFDLSEPGGYIMSVEFGEKEDSGTLGNKIGLSVRSQSFYPYFRDLVKSCCKCIVGPVMLNRIIVFVPSSMEKDEYNQRLEATANAEYVYQKLSEMLDSDFCLGIGRSYQGIDNLFRSYEESVKAIRLTGGKGVVHIMDVPIQSKIGQPYPFMKEKLLLEKASVGDAGACLQVFNSIFDWMISEYGDSIQEIKGKLLELMVLLYRLTWDYEVEDQEYLKGQGYIEEILSLQDIASIRKWSKERIEDLVGGINALKDKRISSVILKARDFINVNFSKEITLEDVSREVNISPRYFSRLFKEETGENFIDYLTLIRIKKAKEYLEKGLFSVKEICFQVGYGDPNYFSRIFKKVVGVTPTEYRNS